MLASLIYHYLPEYVLVNAFLHLELLITLFIGGLLEGIRLPQLLSSVAYLTHASFYAVTTGFYSTPFNPFGLISILIWLFAAVTWVHSMHYTIYCGAQDFFRIYSHSDGKSPFAVGVRNFKITEKKLEASVFYPVDKEKARNNAGWFRNPE